MRYIKLPQNITFCDLYIGRSIFNNYYYDLMESGLTGDMQLKEYAEAFGAEEHILDPRIFQSIIIRTLAGQE